MNASYLTYQEIETYFYKNFNLSYSCNKNLSDKFEKDTTNFIAKFEKIYLIEPIFYNWKGIEFPVFIHNYASNIYNKEGKISFDLYLNVFLFLSGWLEIINTKRDKHGRFPFNESLQHKYNFVTTPVVNIYFELLFEAALKDNISIQRKTFKESIIFTHDIDQLRSGWFENIQYDLKHFSLKSLFRIPKNIFKKVFNLEDDYLNGMKRMLAIDKENNIEAISFLLIKKSHQNADFDIYNSQFKTLIEKTINQQEIGIHTSYSSFNNNEIYFKEVKSLTEFSKKAITKSRQHFLRYDINFTPKIIEESNIEEDYTLGFAEQFGFRNGIANPFHLYNFAKNETYNFKSIPLVFMDASLVNYNQSKNLQELFNETKELINFTLDNYNCNFSILFHNSVFSEVKFKGFTKFYKELIYL